MAQRKELEITISPTGEVSVHVKCIPGQECITETKFLEDALGGEIKARELTSEYYQQPANQGGYNTTSNS
jgi:hypothetical protein